MRSHLEFGEETLASREEYVEHLTRAAKIRGTEEEHDAAYLFMACPLCGARAGADEYLLGHISSHVERLALVSLPAAGWRAKRPAGMNVADLDSDAETSSSGESSFGDLDASRIPEGDGVPEEPGARKRKRPSDEAQDGRGQRAVQTDQTAEEDRTG